MYTSSHFQSRIAEKNSGEPARAEQKVQLMSLIISEVSHRLIKPSERRDPEARLNRRTKRCEKLNDQLGFLKCL